MLFKLRTFPLGVLPLVVVSLLGCNQLSPLGLALPGVTPIGEIRYPPQGNPKVRVKGKVGDRASFLESGAYLLQDSTGSVWVRTSQTLPPKGQELLIEGILEYQSIPLEQQEFGGLYLKEVKQIESIAPTATPSVETKPTATPTSTVSPKPSVKPFKEPFLPHKENKKDN